MDSRELADSGSERTLRKIFIFTLLRFIEDVVFKKNKIISTFNIITI